MKGAIKARGDGMTTRIRLATRGIAGLLRFAQVRGLSRDIARALEEDRGWSGSHRADRGIQMRREVTWGTSGAGISQVQSGPEMARSKTKKPQLELRLRA